MVVVAYEREKSNKQDPGSRVAWDTLIPEVLEVQNARK
jgi:hypothetical protein